MKSKIGHEQLFDVNKKFSARASKNAFSLYSVFFLLSTSDNPGMSCFHKSSLCYFYHVFYLALIDWLIFKSEQI